MGEKTKGWAAIGLGLIFAAAGLYGLLILLGVSFAIGEAASEVGAPVWAILFLPLLAGIGVLVLIAKVIVDRLTSEEDNHYSKTVDR